MDIIYYPVVKNTYYNIILISIYIYIYVYNDLYCIYIATVYGREMPIGTTAVHIIIIIINVLV